MYPVLPPFLFIDLSLQAAQTILSSEKEDALKKLQDISQNFPSVARYYQCRF